MLNSQAIALLVMAASRRVGNQSRSSIKIEIPKPPKLPGEMRNKCCPCGSGLKGKNCECGKFSR